MIEYLPFFGVLVAGFTAAVISRVAVIVQDRRARRDRDQMEAPHERAVNTTRADPLSPALRAEIYQTASWWDREFLRLCRAVDGENPAELFPFSPALAVVPTVIAYTFEGAVVERSTATVRSADAGKRVRVFDVFGLPLHGGVLEPDSTGAYPRFLADAPEVVIEQAGERIPLLSDAFPSQIEGSEDV